MSCWCRDETKKRKIADAECPRIGQGATEMKFPKEKSDKEAHHFDSDSAVALARFRKHVAPPLSEIP